MKNNIVYDEEENFTKKLHQKNMEMIDMRYEAREYVYLDGSSIQLEGKEVVERDEIKGFLFNNNVNFSKKPVKYEGRIYEREEKLSLFQNDKDIEIVVPKFVRNYRLVGNYMGICHQNLMAMAKAGIMPVMAGARREIGEVNNNDDFIGQSIEVVERKVKAVKGKVIKSKEDGIVEACINNSKCMIMFSEISRRLIENECISNGEWNGQLLSQDKYNDLIEFINNNHIEMIEEYELEKKSIFKVRKFKGELVKVYGIKDSKVIAKEGENISEEFMGKSCGKMEKIYRKIYILNSKGMEDDKEEIDRWEKRYVRSEISGDMVEVMSAVEEFKEVIKFRYDRYDMVKEDMKGIMKKSSDKLENANVEHSLFELRAVKNKYINSNGKYLKEGEIFSINHSHDNIRSGRENARIRMEERNNNLNKNNGGKYWSAILNKWVSY